MLPARALNLVLTDLVARELQWRGCFRFADEIDEAVQLLARSSAVEAVISHVFPADSAIEAFTVARDSEISGKVLVDVWESA